MPLIQPASVLLSDQAGISVGRSAATANAPICAQAWLRTSRPQRGSRGRQQAFDDDAVKAAPVEATTRRIVRHDLLATRSHTQYYSGADGSPPQKNSPGRSPFACLTRRWGRPKVSWKSRGSVV